jgi:hypothetical protein
MAKFIIIIVMFFPNFEDYLGGNTFIVSHKHDKELVFETQIECFDYITENISDLVLFGKETYSYIEGAEVSEFLCVTKEDSKEFEKIEKEEREEGIDT